MRKISTLLALTASAFLSSQASAANFTAKDASAATIIFTNPGNCTTGCTPIFSWYDSTGVNAVSVLTAGADGASNTANGGLTYSRMLTFNGTTWDRWQGAIKAASGAFASGSIASGAFASGAVSAGAYAAGALAAGAFAAGSGVDGWDLTQGAKADAICGSATGTCSVVSLLKFLNTAVGSSIPAGTALIGDVNLRQGGTALSTTNGIYSNLLQGNAVISATNGLYTNQLQGNAALSATNPSFSRPTDGTSARVFDPCEVVAHVTTPISISSAATSIIVAGTSSKKTYICSMMLFSAGTTNVGIVQGSGSTCGTSTLGLIGGATSGTGPNLTAQAGFVAGNGNFAIAGTTVNANDICLINSAAIQVSGYIVTATP